ncbi:MAG: hypothetical protein MZV64_44730 [Ignavibacteriales bacterium]|nr:hypothetical protein [Ignavibacteriales bacterium]
MRSKTRRVHAQKSSLTIGWLLAGDLVLQLHDAVDHHLRAAAGSRGCRRRPG